MTQPDWETDGAPSVTRTKDGVTQVINVDMREIMERAKVDQDIRIFPGDRIFVEARIFNPL